MSLADDVVSGFQCSHCGVCFQHEHGYPVLCHDCWKHAKPSEREGLRRATHKEL